LANFDGAIDPKAWATSSIGDDPSVTLSELQRGLTVSQIATRRADFHTCLYNEDLSTVVVRNRSNNFDFLPVTNNDTIVGLLEIASFRNRPAPDISVYTEMMPLSEEYVFGADASILEFVRTADKQRCRLIVSGHQISGLVSLSDLQQLPVRAALFGIITYLEMLLMKAIRAEHHGSESWIDRLPPKRQDKLNEEISKARSDNGFVDSLLFTQFADKKIILRKSSCFPRSKTKIDEDLSRIEALRNNIAHANEYASSPEAACVACATVRLIDEWIKDLSDWMPTKLRS
jgi:CBS domain-containing protein